MSVCLRFNPGVRISQFDGAGESLTFLCELPSEDGIRSARFVLKSDLIDFLKQFDGTRPTADIGRDFSATHTTHSLEELIRLVDEYCIPKKLLIDAAHDGAQAADLSAKRGYLYHRVTLFGPRLVAAAASPLSSLFRVRVALAVLPLVILTQVIFFGRFARVEEFDISNISGYDVFLLTTVASFLGLFHELGHAAALSRFGGRSAGIGWGLYLWYLVFYTDLSEAWRLKRTQRAMVDLGGVYFHAISLVFLLGLIWYTGSRLLIYSFFYVDLQIAQALNPYLRMDGYWLVADFFGIANLRDRTLRSIERPVLRLLGVMRPGAPEEAQMNRRTRLFLAVYAAIGLGWFCFLWQVLIKQIVLRLLPAYPHVVVGFWTILTNTHGSIRPLTDALANVLWKGLVLLGCLRALLTLMVKSAIWVYRVGRLRRERRMAMATGI